MSDPLGHWLGQVDLMLPLPIYSSIVEKSYLITYRENDGNQGRRLSVASQPDFSLVSSAYADEIPKSAAPAQPARPRDLVIGIKRLDVRESGDHDGPVGKVYAKIYLNGRQMQTPTMPQKDFPNTYLSLHDNSKNVFENLLFAIPFPGDANPQKIEIRFYESDFFGKDDLIGVFKTKVGVADVGKALFLESGEVPRAWPNNASITLQVGRR